MKQYHIENTGFNSQLIECLLPTFVEEVLVDLKEVIAAFNRLDYVAMLERSSKISGVSSCFGAFRIKEKASVVLEKLEDKDFPLLVDAVEDLTDEIFDFKKIMLVEGENKVM